MTTVEPHHRTAVTAALAMIACFAAVLLTFVGSFLPLFYGELHALGTKQFEVVITSWGISTDAPDLEGSLTNNGIPLMIAAFLLCLAGIVFLANALGRPNERVRRISTLASTTGAAFLAGVTASVVMQLFSALESFRPTGDAVDNPGVTVHSSIGAGIWLLAGATLVAIVPVGLSLRSTGARPLFTDPVTPRYGFPTPMGQPGAPVSGPATVSPATPGEQQPPPTAQPPLPAAPPPPPAAPPQS